ncbi:MAG TPA: hypothetical protein DCF84_00445 [Bacteroidetes bacterium]|nr:hypothetical protein [Bacteroidota bacterium]
MKNSLVIIGCPRSGTTYLLRLLASCHTLGYVSAAQNTAPNKLLRSRDLRVFNTPLLGGIRYAKRRYEHALPVESWAFYNNYLPGFQWKIDHGGGPKINYKTEEIDAFRRAVDGVLKESGRQRFLFKYTDFSRLDLLYQIDPTCQVIHLTRHPLSVIFSYSKKMERGEFNTWNEREAWSALWDKKLFAIYHEYKEALCEKALAGCLWAFFIRKIKQDIRVWKGRAVQTYVYEDLFASYAPIKDLFKNNNLTYNLGVQSFLRNNKPVVYNYDESLEKYRVFVDSLINYVE